MRVLKNTEKNALKKARHHIFEVDFHLPRVKTKSTSFEWVGVNAICQKSIKWSETMMENVREVSKMSEIRNATPREVSLRFFRSVSQG